MTIRSATLFVITCMLVACGGKPATQPQAPEAAPAAPAAEAAPSTSESGLESAAAGAAAAGPGGELAARRIVYFDFDKSDLRPNDAALVGAHARWIAANPGARVRLEGHTDARGTREYNIGLGERRAQSVRRAMLLQGVVEAQLGTVSYGEEQPAAAGEDEAAFSKNRRVEIVYGN